MNLKITEKEIAAYDALRLDQPLTTAARKLLEQLAEQPKRLMALKALVDERDGKADVVLPDRITLAEITMLRRTRLGEERRASKKQGATPRRARSVSPPKTTESGEADTAPKPSRRFPLSEASILEAATVFMEHRRLLPFAQTKGSVPGLPGETWLSIDQAIRAGDRGLTKNPRGLCDVLAPLWEKSL